VTGPTGVGATGAAGVGATGATGVGATGATGVGATGATGATGVGATGATGVGATGATGAGATGAAGVGATGATGAGATGATGPTGVGATGPTGVGATGPTCVGATGPTGVGATGVGATGPTGATGVGATGATGVGATGATGSTGAGVTGPTGPIGSIAEFAMFFGMPAGPGNIGANDYPATFAISPAPPSIAAGSAINFPRPSVPPIGISINDPGVTQANNTEFILPSVGVYRVTWHATFAEPAQTSLFINITPTPGGGGTFNTVQVSLGTPGNVERATGTSQLIGDVVFQNPVAGSVIQIRNWASPQAITITPPAGAGTQAQAAVIIIQRLA
ncbi:Hypothetical protein HVR_LOCUS793, partial [uncultured virus]